ncbi:hypothetical protein JCM33374_g3438 [Metschnikowia sp. JCM 33374]|nr:hypothetical protein JCM33374_g3438 [Metschnikowia sp. JCM 33374]
MDEEDDNWSYSFPPSTEDLSCSKMDGEKVEGEMNRSKTSSGDSSMGWQASASYVVGCDDRFKSKSSLNLNVPNFPRRVRADEHSNSHSKDENHNTLTLQSDTSLKPQPIEQDVHAYQGTRVYKSECVNGLQKVKQSSLVLQPAFMSKSAPADPQTTMKDANSIISKESASNALLLIGDTPSSPSLSPTSRSDFRSSMKIWQQKTNEDGHLLNSSDQASGSDLGECTSPKIITYRKTTHERKTSNSLKLEDPEDKFDSKLYVNEKYKDTGYRYATIKRNVDFHQLFKSIDLTDRLLDDFACAISREILLQGRVYVTENCLCFNSNLLGWVTSLVVPYSEITRIDKKSTAGLFPNGIIVETRTSKHNFASFLSRDATFEFIRTIWSAATGKNLSDLDSHPVETFDTGVTKLSERRISDYIRSIDEGDNVDVKWNDDHFEDSEEDLSDMNTDGFEDNAPENHSLKGISKSDLGKIRTMRPDSEYSNRGPDSHAPTKISGDFEGSNDETEVVNDIIQGPLGAVFEILFGRENPSFHKKVLEDQGATNISNYGPFESVEGHPTKPERHYSYQRPLGYSIGPKSTKCCVKEIIEHHDLEEGVVVLSITDTPDVPSGGSFSVMTRFYLNWSENNSTELKIAYHIKWTGRSWIKSMVENSTSSAQTSVSKKLIEQLKEEVEKQTHCTDFPFMPALNQSVNSSANIPSKVQETMPIKVIGEKKDSCFSFKNVITLLVFLVVILFALVIYLHLVVASQISDFKQLLTKQEEVLGMLLELTMGKEGINSDDAIQISGI